MSHLQLVKLDERLGKFAVSLTLDLEVVAHTVELGAGNDQALLDVADVLMEDHGGFSPFSVRRFECIKFQKRLVGWCIHRLASTHSIKEGKSYASYANWLIKVLLPDQRMWKPQSMLGDDHSRQFPVALVLGVEGIAQQFENVAGHRATFSKVPDMRMKFISCCAPLIVRDLQRSKAVDQFEIGGTHETPPGISISFVKSYINSNSQRMGFRNVNSVMRFA